jgi:flavin reductase (DIM6/NTAB) family NADH-FMN oxidoreductase RutF
MIIIPKDIDPKEMYKILIGSVLPRPIAWVSTISKEGIANLAPFSFFTVASTVPPVLCFAPQYNKTEIKNGKEIPVAKDTLANVRETKEFVVNMVSHSVAEQMNQTSAPYPHNVSEFEEAKLTAKPALHVKPPLVAESLINMECKLYDILEIGKGMFGGCLILGEIVCVHFSPDVYKDTHIDLEELDSIGRLSGNLYSTIKDRFELVRPTIEAIQT